MSFKKILVKICQFVTQCRKIAGSHGSNIFSPSFFKAVLETYRDHQSLLSSPLLPVKWDVFSENLLMIDVAGTYPNDHFHPTYILYYTIILHYTQMASHWLSKYLIKKNKMVHRTMKRRSSIWWYSPLKTTLTLMLKRPKKWCLYCWGLDLVSLSPVW